MPRACESAPVDVSGAFRPFGKVRTPTGNLSAGSSSASAIALPSLSMHSEIACCAMKCNRRSISGTDRVVLVVMGETGKGRHDMLLVDSLHISPATSADKTTVSCTKARSGRRASSRFSPAENRRLKASPRRRHALVPASSAIQTLRVSDRETKNNGGLHGTPAGHFIF